MLARTGYYHSAHVVYKITLVEIFQRMQGKIHLRKQQEEFTEITEVSMGLNRLICITSAQKLAETRHLAEQSEQSGSLGHF